MLIWVLSLLAAYLLGSVSFALLLGKLAGIDIRSKGSGNVGATNLGRILGKKWGIGCFLLDVGKGLFPMLGYHAAITMQPADMPQQPWLLALMWLAIGIAAVLGHVFPLWHGFKGGKGVATSLGALLGYWPILTIPAAVCGLIWFITAKATAYVGLASVVAAIAMPFLAVGFALMRGRPIDEIAVVAAVTSLLAGLIVIRHRGNLARLRAGTETKATWAQKACDRNTETEGKGQRSEG